MPMIVTISRFNMEILEKSEARAKKYRPLTQRYALPREKWMLDNVIKDMEVDNIDAVLVPFPLKSSNGSKKEGYEVWRHSSSFIDE